MSTCRSFWCSGRSLLGSLRLRLAWGIKRIKTTWYFIGTRVEPLVVSITVHMVNLPRLGALAEGIGRITGGPPPPPMPLEPLLKRFCVWFPWPNGNGLPRPLPLSKPPPPKRLMLWDGGGGIPRGSAMSKGQYARTDGNTFEVQGCGSGNLATATSEQSKHPSDKIAQTYFSLVSSV